MKKKFKLSLFIFRRDIRLYDNTALNEALSSSEVVIPCFIFDDRQMHNNLYFGENAFLFLLQSLAELSEALEKQDGVLYFLKGIAETCVEMLLTTLPIEAVFLNRDYTPFSKRRDGALKKIAKENKVCFFDLPDALLCEPEMVHKKDGLPYTVFTPFFNQAATLPVKPPQSLVKGCFYKNTITIADQKFLTTILERFYKHTAILGGRQSGEKLLKKIQQQENYALTRDFPYQHTTSYLSAHHKFGTISIRESYHQVKDSTFRKELYWRDFFTHIGFHFPKVFSGAFHEKYNHIAWTNNKKHFQSWCDGKTGFPIVDAGMRELNETGYMHNRVRMIVASFLVKDLHIDWRWGEQYFAHKLVDYDPAVNNGNWQWAASTGCDAQPYFRIFNPLLQQKRFDPEGKYIEIWVPEIHQARYPKPIVDHAVAASYAKQLFKIKD